MKFRRSYRGHGRHVYVIRKARRYMLDGLQEYDRGLRAEFNEGFFDTEAAQLTLAWTDEERDLVERFLMRHQDFGHGLYLDPSEKGASVATPERPAAIEGQPGESRTVCIAWDENGDGESTMCGRPTVDDAGEFCARHVELAGTAVGAGATEGA